MFDLFRFIMLRPPEKGSRDDAIDIGEPSDLKHDLEAARNGDAALEAMRNRAAAYVAAEEFVSDPGTTVTGPKLMDFWKRVVARGESTLQSLGDDFSHVFDAPAQQIVSSEPLQTDRRRVHDSIIAAKIASSAVSGTVDHLISLTRAIALAERLAAGDVTLNAPGAVKRALVAPLKLPATIFPLPPPAHDQAPESEDTKAKADELTARLSALEGTLADLEGVSPDDYVIPSPQAPAAREQPQRQATELMSTSLLERFASGTLTIIAQPAVPNRMSTRITPFQLRNEALSRLQPTSLEVVRDLNIDLTNTPLNLVSAKIRGEVGYLRKAIQGLPVIIQPNWTMPPLPLPVPAPPVLPTVHGHIKPVGMADLLVVKYHLLRYERGEIAYVENILRGESSTRSTRRLETTEEITVQETESTREEERDLQSTERFELKNEIDNTVSAEGSLKAGSAFSPAYGPMLEFQGGTDSPVSGAQTQASRQASNYSREMTSRSASKVTERVRKQITLRKLQEFEEKNRHVFDNTKAGASNISGVYQWLEKVLRAQVFNYGRRLMFDIMVPQPGAFLQQALLASPTGRIANRPAEFKLGPTEVGEWNYSSLAAQYGATGIEPPPEPRITVSRTFSGRNPNPTINAVHAVEQPIPDGYQAADSWIHHKLNVWGQDWHIEVTVGKAAVRADNATNPNGWGVGLNSEVQSIPITVCSYLVEAYSVSVEVNCYRTTRNMQSWQSRTHDAILRAYQQRLSEYEEQLANMQSERRVENLNRNPEDNRKLIRDELRKNTISVFTYQHFDIFNGTELSPEGYVQSNLPIAETQGAYVRFFEQAFEWEQMIFLLYPYFWGTKFFWMFKMGIDELDPGLKDFLKAGAARVTVPVRPGFEQAVAHYLETGELWNGGDPPDVTSETYLPIVQEVKERDAAPTTETPYGDAWEIRLPTSLVSLRSDDALPSWKETPAGSGIWVEG